MSLAPDQGSEPPYRRIAAEIRRRIDSGELTAGERAPSTRQITREWGVAMATATKVLATLRQEGLVQAVPGVGTVVRDVGTVVRGTPPRSAPARGQVRDQRELSQEAVVRTAIEVADADGLAAVSMRRVASELGVGAMTLYRYVAGKEELFQLMADAVFGEDDLPEPGPAGWRDRLGFVARLQWKVYRRHPWVTALVAGVSQPPLMPNGMAQVEWQLRALTGLDLDPLTQIRIVITVNGFVSGLALSREVETEAQLGSSLAGREWRSASQADAIFASGRFPLLASLIDIDDREPDGDREGVDDREPVDDREGVDLDATFEFGLQCQLDGIAVLLERPTTR